MISLGFKVVCGVLCCGLWCFVCLVPPLTIRHCMFCRKTGAEGTVLQTLCHFVILNARCNVYHSTDSAYFVKSTPPRAFSVSF